MHNIRAVITKVLYTFKMALGCSNAERSASVVVVGVDLAAANLERLHEQDVVVVGGVKEFKFVLEAGLVNDLADSLTFPFDCAAFKQIVCDFVIDGVVEGSELPSVDRVHGCAV